MDVRVALDDLRRRTEEVAPEERTPRRLLELTADTLDDVMGRAETSALAPLLDRPADIVHRAAQV